MSLDEMLTKARLPLKRLMRFDSIIKQSAMKRQRRQSSIPSSSWTSSFIAFRGSLYLAWAVMRCLDYLRSDA